MAINQIAEVMEWSKLEPVIQLVLGFLQDQHPRVRFASINVVGQVSVDHGHELRMKYHGVILDGLGKVLDDFGFPRLQAHACGALINFCEVPEDAIPELEE